MNYIPTISTTEGSITSNIRCNDIGDDYIVVDKSLRSLGLLMAGGKKFLYCCKVVVQSEIVVRTAVVVIRNKGDYLEFIEMLGAKSTMYDMYMVNELGLKNSKLLVYYYKKLREGFRNISQIKIYDALTDNQVNYGYHSSTGILPNKPAMPLYTEPFSIKQQVNIQRYEVDKLLEVTRQKAKRLSAKHIERLEHEIKVLQSMGMLNYFVLVSKIVNKIRADRQYFSAGRGSVGGSLFAYLMGVTSFDPLANHHIKPAFIRFVNENRKELPDIDLDVPSTYRATIIDYIDKHIGKVYKINNMMTLGEKQCQTLAKKMKYNVETYTSVNQGLATHVSQHAGGIIITDGVVPHYNVGGQRICDYNMGVVDVFGYIKVDVLGVANLDFIRECAHSAKITDKELEYMYTRENKEVIASTGGDTIGIFQFGSTLSQRVLHHVNPVKYKHLVDLNVLMLAPFVARKVYKTYARAKGDGKMVSDIFHETYGLMLYQDQIYQYGLNHMGMTASHADDLRKYCSKAARYKNQLAELLKKYDDGTHGAKINELLLMAGYTWNVSHALAYTRLTYVNLYLRYKYPLTFYMCALNLNYRDVEAVHRIMLEVKRVGISVKYSTAKDFSFFCEARDGKLLIGLCMIKGLTERTYNYLREYIPTVKSLSEFKANLTKTKCNRKLLSALIFWKFFGGVQGDVKELNDKASKQFELFRIFRHDVWKFGIFKKNQELVLASNNIAGGRSVVIVANNEKVADAFANDKIKVGDYVERQGVKITRHFSHV